MVFIGQVDDQIIFLTFCGKLKTERQEARQEFRQSFKVLHELYAEDIKRLARKTICLHIFSASLSSQ